MFQPSTILAAIFLYIGLLFAVGLWVERKASAGRNIANHPLIYSLSLAIYCTSWTYYGSVGNAASSGMFFLTIYLGPTLVIFLWWHIMRKLVRLKNSLHITSIADFIAARYGKSQLLAAMATVIALIGALPYIALQLKAVISTFAIITALPENPSSWITRNVGPIVVLLMIFFTIIFGVRRLDPTERHQGMVVVVAVESLVKLFTFLAVGIFVTYAVFSGFGDIFTRLAARPVDSAATVSHGPLMWGTYLLLSMSAILFLPRQFHIAVVENSDEGHIRTAMWLFPLYMFLINIFVFPIAKGGLLSGLPLREADTFVLRMPLLYGKAWLTLLVFIGGFSAATSMVMISSMTLATMSTNHLLLPLADWARPLGFLRRDLLRARWAAVAAILMSGYWFQAQLGNSFSLIRMGIISFAAILQFAPAILGGIFWRRGSKAGAVMGLAAGFLVWACTLFLPPLVRNIQGAASLFQGGYGMLLDPEQLLGLTAVAPETHAVLLSMFFNVGLYVLGSLLFPTAEEERRQADSFVDVLAPAAAMNPVPGQVMLIGWKEKERMFREVLGQYFPPTEARAMLASALRRLAIGKKTRILITELADIHNEVEKTLAGTIGTAAAHTALKRKMIFSPAERRALQDAYAEMLAGLSLTPEEVKRKIDYYRERDHLLTSHAEELEKTVRELEEQVRQRKRSEEALRNSEGRLEKAQDQLRRLSGAIMAGQEKERRAVARELHDELAQLLTALRLDCAWLQKRVQTADPQAAERASSMDELVGRTIDEVRKIAIRLRPGVLDDLGLIDALEWLTADFIKRTGITCSFSHHAVPRVSEVVATAAYRITQEALTNIVRHAAASQVEISLDYENGVLTLAIRDNGRGFDTSGLEDCEGLGIAGMRERASLVNGRLIIQSRPGQGSEVYFRLGGVSPPGG